jgi:hypothetical protein
MMFGTQKNCSLSPCFFQELTDSNRFNAMNLHELHHRSEATMSCVTISHDRTQEVDDGRRGALITRHPASLLSLSIAFQSVLVI